VFQADLAIQASMTTAASALQVLPAPTSLPWVAWTKACHQDYRDNLQPTAIAGVSPTELEGVVNMPHIVETLQKHLPPDTVLTNGAGNYASWIHRYFRFHGLAKGHKTQLAPTNGAMGYGVPAGIAAAITTGRLAFTITGDGDFLMNGQELATAVQYGAKTIIMLLNNSMLGTIRMHQEREYPQRVAGTDLRNPDFVALAKAYGYVGQRIIRSEQFEAALLAALARPEGTLLEIMLNPELISTRCTLSQITQSAVERDADQR